MPNRRRFAPDIAGASCVMLALTSFLHAATRGQNDSMIALNDVPSMCFTGSHPGEEK